MDQITIEMRRAINAINARKDVVVADRVRLLEICVGHLHAGAHGIAQVTGNESAAEHFYICADHFVVRGPDHPVEINIQELLDAHPAREAERAKSATRKAWSIYLRSGWAAVRLTLAAYGALMLAQALAPTLSGGGLS